jgi:hypothetical protein
MKYPVADSYATKLIVNVVDGNQWLKVKHVFWHPLALFIYSLKQYPTKKTQKEHQQIVVTFQQQMRF